MELLRIHYTALDTWGVAADYFTLTIQLWEPLRLPFYFICRICGWHSLQMQTFFCRIAFQRCTAADYLKSIQLWWSESALTLLDHFESLMSKGERRFAALHYCTMYHIMLCRFSDYETYAVISSVINPSNPFGYCDFYEWTKFLAAFYSVKLQQTFRKDIDKSPRRDYNITVKHTTHISILW